MLPLAKTGVSRTAATPSRAPVTRTGTRWLAVWNSPAGLTAFCLASELNKAWVGTPERREFGVAEFDENALGLIAEEIDLGDVGHALQAQAQRFGDLLQLRVGRALAVDRVEHRVDIAEFVIDDRPDEARPAGRRACRRASCADR